MAITVPTTIEDVIARFDRTAGALNELEIKAALVAARRALTNPSDAENLGAWAEVLAFALIGSTHQSSPWNTYFCPLASGTNEDGTPFFAPDIAGTDAEVVAHWMRRARSITHPVLKARYADLAWDMSRAIAKTRPVPEMAAIAIDAYLDSITENLRNDVHDHFNGARRALDLAAMIHDTVRIDSARAALLKLHRDTSSSENWLWWIAFDRLIDDKRARLNDDERDQLIADLEGIVRKHSVTSNGTEFDPHATEGAARRLIAQYRKRGRTDDARRLNAVIGQTFEFFATLSDAMIASSTLQTAVNAYRDAGMPHQCRKVRVLMEQRIAESHEQMASITTETYVSKDDVEAFLSAVVDADLGTTFVRIASEFLQRRSDVEKSVSDLTEHAPLLAMITHSIMANDHVAATVGSVADDPFGRLIQQAAQGMSLSDNWLIRALDRTVEVHHVTPDHFVSWAARTALFEDLTLLREGVTAWFEQDYVKAIHVLVPQVEVGLRGIVTRLGYPATKPHSTLLDVSVAIGMGDILYSKNIVDALGPDLTLHFLAVYADPRGFNLRNDTAHGLMSVDRIDIFHASRLLHTLLLFGIWDQLAAARSNHDRPPVSAPPS